jgi:hypothetical protein
MQRSIWTFRWNHSFMHSCKNSEIVDQVIRYGVQVGCQDFTIILLEISQKKALEIAKWFRKLTTKLWIRPVPTVPMGIIGISSNASEFQGKETCKNLLF